MSQAEGSPASLSWPRRLMIVGRWVLIIHAALVAGVIGAWAAFTNRALHGDAFVGWSMVALAAISTYMATRFWVSVVKLGVRKRVR